MNTKQVIKQLEKNYNYLYLDSSYKVTIGYGFMYDNPHLFYHDFAGALFIENERREPTKTEVVEAFNKVLGSGDCKFVLSAKQTVCTNNYRASFFSSKSKIRAKPHKIEELFDRKYIVAKSDAERFFNSFKLEIENKFKYFGELPESVQAALIDMSFNLGFTKLRKFHSLNKYLHAGDWNNAAKQSHRVGAEDERNRMIFNMITDGELEIKSDLKLSGINKVESPVFA